MDALANALDREAQVPGSPANPDTPPNITPGSGVDRPSLVDRLREKLRRFRQMLATKKKSQPEQQVIQKRQRWIEDMDKYFRKLAKAETENGKIESAKYNGQYENMTSELAKILLKAENSKSRARISEKWREQDMDASRKMSDRILELQTRHDAIDNAIFHAREQLRKLDDTSDDEQSRKMRMDIERQIGKLEGQQKQCGHYLEQEEWKMK